MDKTTVAVDIGERALLGAEGISRNIVFYKCSIFKLLAHMSDEEQLKRLYLFIKQKQ